jgi:hypothetical protein
LLSPSNWSPEMTFDTVARFMVTAAGERSR